MNTIKQATFADTMSLILPVEQHILSLIFVLAV